MNVMRSIRVNPVLNGFVVEVGCQTLVFNRIEDVAENLVAYQKDPDGMEKKFAAAAVNKTLDNGGEAPRYVPNAVGLNEVDAGKTSAPY